VPTDNPSPKPPPYRVHIVGGGCAGLSAAWQLSKLEGYEIHVYERSWRLGGKGASGRGPDGRIQEHGLHVWLGFYENAFRMMRECYAEVEKNGWGPKAGARDRLAHACFDDAFSPEPQIGVGIGKSNIWLGYLPPARGLPGDDLDVGSNPFTLVSYMSRCLLLAKALMQSVIAKPDYGAPQPTRPDGRSALDEDLDNTASDESGRSPGLIVERMARMLRGGVLVGAAGLLQAVVIFENWMHSVKLNAQTVDTVLQFADAIAAQTRKLLGSVASTDDDVRRKTEIIDLVITIVVGLYRDKVLFDDRGLDAINDIDYRDWLRKHGATRESLQSPFLTGIYDLVFAYRDGDVGRPALAAGVALRGALRMFFTYRGAMFWRMRSGMGDTVFAPLYKVLRKRGVRFHLQHKLRCLEFDKPKQGELPRVTKLKFLRAPTKQERVLDHLGGWQSTSPDPDEKKWIGLRRDVSGDALILATGIADLESACGQAFISTAPGWSNMIKRVETVGTYSLQVWFDRSLDDLGWHRGPAIVSALGKPLQTWADMTQTLPSEEDWRGHANLPATGDASVAYLCSVDPQHAVHLSPSGPLATDSPDLVCLDGIRARLWPQMPSASSFVKAAYHSINAAGSDRYTQSLPRTSSARLSPLELQFENLTIAGDWTATGLDAGCIEGAVMSGMLAAHAITSDQPSLDSIVGFHHP